MVSESWKALRVVLRADSPIHIGWHNLGMIQRTRYYIPGRTLWGALASGLARSRFASEDVPTMYRFARDLCKQSLRFTYFFAAGSLDQAQDDSKLWRPKYQKSGQARRLMYGDKTVAALESMLVYSEASAAIAYGSRTAAQGALHETEYLLLEWRESDEANYAGGHKRLHFAGYVFYRDNDGKCGINEEELKAVFSKLQVGAERRYGWGRLSLASCKPVDVDSIFFEGYNLQRAMDSATEFTVTTSSEDCEVYLPSHLVCEPERSNDAHESTSDVSSDYCLQGDVEAVAGRDWSERGSGQRLSDMEHCWTPGTACVSRGRRFKINEYGLWQQIHSPSRTM